MRDMQSRYSHYLNIKYKATPWLLIAPLYGCRDLDHFSPYLRMGPVTRTHRSISSTKTTPRYHAEYLDAAGFQAFLRYVRKQPRTRWSRPPRRRLALVQRPSPLHWRRQRQLTLH